MERQEIFEKVKAIVGEQLNIKQTEVNWDFPIFDTSRGYKLPPSYPPRSFFNNPSSTECFKVLDEVDNDLCICMMLETEFDIDFFDEDLRKILTVQHAVDYIEADLKLTKIKYDSLLQ